MGYTRQDEFRLRQEICAVGKRLYELFLIAGNDGNISVRLGDDQILMTPSGISKGRMKPEDMVIVGPDGTLVQAMKGRVPSSEHRMHLEIYRRRADISAVVHAHPSTATGLAVAGVGLDQIFLPEAVIRTGATPLAPYTIPGGNELPESLIPFIADHDTLLIGNHGVVAYARELWDAQACLETVELTARIYLAARTAGNVNFLSPTEIEALRGRYG
jgi:L-fuculose-phosphate aldolase